MAYAQFRKTHTTHNSGRFVVSEGIAPSCYLLPHQGLPTWYSDTEDSRFEIVIPKGTILSVVADDNGDARLVPSNGTGSQFVWNDTTELTTDQTGATPSSNTGTPSDDDGTITVKANSIPIGCAQYNLYRPFDKGTSQGGGWITFGYVEWPTAAGLNDDVEVGDQVMADQYGRPVKAAPGTKDYLTVGNVIEIEKFATNFDDGLLSYMQFPSDPGALREVYALTKTGTYQGKLGIRKNLDVANSTGAMRVVLKLT